MHMASIISTPQCNSAVYARSFPHVARCASSHLRSNETNRRHNPPPQPGRSTSGVRKLAVAVGAVLRSVALTSIPATGFPSVPPTTTREKCREHTRKDTRGRQGGNTTPQSVDREADDNDDDVDNGDDSNGDDGSGDEDSGSANNNSNDNHKNYDNNRNNQCRRTIFSSCRSANAMSQKLLSAPLSPWFPCCTNC
jgi:hypothetical protein